MLDEEYRPQSPLLTWEESFVLDTNPDTPAPKEVVLKVK